MCFFLGDRFWSRGDLFPDTKRLRRRLELIFVFATKYRSIGPWDTWACVAEMGLRL